MRGSVSSLKLLYYEHSLTPTFVRSIHRIGQQTVCQYDYLISQDSLDERVFKKIQDKFTLLDKIIDRSANKDGYAVEENELFEREFEDEGEPSFKKQKCQ